MVWNACKLQAITKRVGTFSVIGYFLALTITFGTFWYSQLFLNLVIKKILLLDNLNVCLLHLIRSQTEL